MPKFSVPMIMAWKRGYSTAVLVLFKWILVQYVCAFESNFNLYQPNKNLAHSALINI